MDTGCNVATVIAIRSFHLLLNNYFTADSVVSGMVVVLKVIALVIQRLPV